MNDGIAKQVHELLKEAFALEPHERKEFLRQACARQAGLRPHVDRLLAAVNDSQSFLERPALGKSRSQDVAVDDADPERVGNYRIVRKLGAGGMGAVYEAIQRQPERTVAIKIPRQRGRDNGSPLRLRYESEVLARLRHANIAQIYEAGIDANHPSGPLPYFAMEFVPHARSIREFVQSERLTTRETLLLFVTVCDAIHHGHRLGVIHRDLKPANILVDGEGCPKVIDFGVASSRDDVWIKRASADKADPSTSEVERPDGVSASHQDPDVVPRSMIGTLNYMSPEHCDPQADVDVQSDVYSLGVMLYELLCGRLPFELASLPILQAFDVIRQRQPLPPSQFRRGIAGDLDAIVLRALAKSPADRYRSVDALQADIERYLCNRPVEARPPRALHFAKLFARRHRVLVSASFLVFAAVVAGVVLSSYSAWQMWREAERRRRAEVQALQERDDAIWQNYVANIAAGFAALQARELRQVRTRLAQAPEQHRGWEWQFLAGMAEVNQRTIRAQQDMILGFDVSRDERLLATAGRDGSVSVWQLGQNEPLLTIGAPETGESTAQAADQNAIRAMCVAFNWGQDRLAVGNGRGNIRIYDLATGDLLRELAPHATAVTSLAFQDGGLLASASQDGACKLWNIETGEAQLNITDGQRGIQGVTYSPDGKFLATWNRAGSVILRSRDGSTIIRQWSLQNPIRSLIFSRDGQYMAAGDGDGLVHYWDRDSDEQPKVFLPEGSPSTVMALAISTEQRLLAAGRVDRTIAIYSLADHSLVGTLSGHEETVSGLWFDEPNRCLYSSSWDSTVRVWDIASIRQPGGIKIYDANQSYVYSVAFSPDGGLLAAGCGDGLTRLWDPNTGDLLAELRGDRRAITAVAFSPDGQRIATGSVDHSIRLWDATTGEPLDELPGHEGMVLTLAFNHDGTQLVSGGGDETVRLWNVPERRELWKHDAHGSRVIHVAFSPDGTQIASGARNHSLFVWDAATGTVRHRLQGHQADVFAVEFSNDGQRLYSGSRDQSLRVWDTWSGRLLDPLDGHGQFITSLDLSPDGRRLAAGSWFGEIVIWDTDRHDVVASFKGHQQAIRALAFCPSGRWLATGSQDGTCRTYDTLSAVERARAESEARQSRIRAEEILDSIAADGTALHAIAQRVDQIPDLSPSERRWCRHLLLSRGPSAPSRNEINGTVSD